MVELDGKVQTSHATQLGIGDQVLVGSGNVEVALLIRLHQGRLLPSAALASANAPDIAKAIRRQNRQSLESSQCLPVNRVHQLENGGVDLERLLRCEHAADDAKGLLADLHLIRQQSRVPFAIVGLCCAPSNRDELKIVVMAVANVPTSLLSCHALSIAVMAVAYRSFSTCLVSRLAAALASFSARLKRILAIFASALLSKLLPSTRSDYGGALILAAAPLVASSKSSSASPPAPHCWPGQGPASR